jgi:hypothetical protein
MTFHLARADREPLRDELGRSSRVDAFERRNEFDCGAAAIAIAKAPPQILVQVADELLAVAATMDRAAPEVLRSDFLELTQDAVPFEHGRERHGPNLLEIEDAPRMLDVHVRLLELKRPSLVSRRLIIRRLIKHAIDSSLIR